MIPAHSRRAWRASGSVPFWRFGAARPGRLSIDAVCVCTALLVALGFARQAHAQQRPNIVFLFSDDHAAHALSAYRAHLPYGARLPDTPELDRLASQGMLFVNAFVTNSICAPSRATILTGQYSHLNGVMTNREVFPTTSVTFPRLLRDAGYATALFGKWHLKSDPVGFDHYEVLTGQGPYYNPMLHTATDSARHTGYTQDILTDRALRWLDARRDRTQPFLLMLQYNAPHRYWDPGPAQLALYRDTVFAEPATFWDDGAGRASGFRLQEMEVGLDLFERDLKLIDPTGFTPEQLARWKSVYDAERTAASTLTGDALTRWKYQRYITDYMRVVAALDANIGRVLAHLDSAGLGTNTIVMYSSDQGFFLGDHGWFDKRWMYEESLRTPLLVRWPGTVRAGTVNTDLVMNLDFAQTFLEAGGVRAPAEMQGRSLVPLLRGNTPADWRDAIYYQYFEYPDWHMVQRHYGVRTKRYKLICYYELDEWELFDLDRDPNELNSVYDEPAYHSVAATLKAKLNELRRTYRAPAEDTMPHFPFNPPAGQRRAPGLRRSGAPTSVIRINQLGYLPQSLKVAVLCARDGALPQAFTVRDESGRTVQPPKRIENAGAYPPCAASARLDFSAITAEGRYTIEAGDSIDTAPAVAATVRISADTYRGAADTLLAYMRQQRSLFNPFFRDSVHAHTDGMLVDHPRAGEFIDVAGGWADAADYLQYVTTSATATFAMLVAYRDHPRAFGDAYDARGLPGANRIPDVLDEARWGLEWLVKMHPQDDLILNQLGDDRDHAFPDLPTNDSSDYGWGRGGFRPVYPCTGRPQGLFQYRNRADGKASTAGKMAAAFALGAELLRTQDAAFANTLARKARTAYAQGRQHPGACQTAPGRAPYFYEEENWVDDMELAASQLFSLTGERDFLKHAIEYAAREPVTPWMGRDTARHYEFYPWHNYGHYEIWRRADDATKRTMIDYYRSGLEAVAARADATFYNGVPFIWCSNDLVTSFATQAWLYRRMTGDVSFTYHEQAAIDWLFGTNPWGTSMVIGLPRDADHPTDPHSIVSRAHGYLSQLGGLVDGPVYRSIFQSLLYINLHEQDEYAPWNTGRAVYHDDWGDYSTNEPIMDGTAALVYILAALADPATR